MTVEPQSELESLRAQVAQLGAQVRLLVKTEQRLGAVRKEVEAERRSARLLNQFALHAPHTLSDREILVRAFDLLWPLYSVQAAAALWVREDGEELALLRAADEPARPVSFPHGPPFDWSALPTAPVLAEAPGAGPHAALFSWLEGLAPPAAWESHTTRSSWLLLPLGGQAAGAGRALIACRCAADSYHQDVPRERDLPFLELAGRHVTGAMEIAALHSRLEARVALRTAAADEANRQLEASLSSLRQTQQQLVQAEKLALASRLAGLVAHEVNNPLAVVRAALDLLQREVPMLVKACRAAQTAADELALHPALRELAARLQRDLPGPFEARALQETSEAVDDARRSTDRIRELVAGFAQLALVERSSPPEVLDVQATLNEFAAESPTRARRAVTLAAPPQGPLVRAFISHHDLRASLLALLGFLQGQAPGDAGPVQLRLEEREGRAEVVLERTAVPATEEEVRQFFDPKLEVVQLGPSRSMRLSLALALTYRFLARSGSELVAAVSDGMLVFRIRLPAPPSGQSG